MSQHVDALEKAYLDLHIQIRDFLERLNGQLCVHAAPPPGPFNDPLWDDINTLNAQKGRYGAHRAAAELERLRACG